MPDLVRFEVRNLSTSALVAPRKAAWNNQKATKRAFLISSLFTHVLVLNLALNFMTFRGTVLKEISNWFRNFIFWILNLLFKKT